MFTLFALYLQMDYGMDEIWMRKAVHWIFTQGHECYTWEKYVRVGRSMAGVIYGRRISRVEI